jgi:broad specificity phosphatase PhoE
LSENIFMRLIFLSFLLVTGSIVTAQTLRFGNAAQVYLVRHGEKEAGEDPLLTTEGNTRAGDLARVLKDKRIARIYVTEYKRTQHTGDSVRLNHGVEMVTYASDTSCTDLVDKIIANKDTNKPILIIGHSNTVPLIIRKLALPGYPKEYIPANEFDNLFLLRFKNGKPTLSKSKFGKASGASATMH